MNSKRWGICVLIGLGIAMLGIATVTIVIDPFFHYHAPLNGLAYTIDNQRYQNDGITKHFEYDTIITGTSMTECFRPSEADALFNAKTIKVSYSGASFKEINDNLSVACRNNKNLKRVIRCLDANRILKDPDYMYNTEDTYPWYLYDDNPLNDAKYLLNMSVLRYDFQAVLNGLKGESTTSFDDYSYWDGTMSYGKEAVLSHYAREHKADSKFFLTENERKTIEANLEQNVISLAKENPNVEFDLFISPYSIVFWDSMNQSGTLEKQLEIEKTAIDTLCKYDNIHIFSFEEEYEMICNLDNYKDITHYSAEINSQILAWMHDGIHEITKDNVVQYYDNVVHFYTTYDYDSLF